MSTVAQARWVIALVACGLLQACSGAEEAAAPADAAAPVRITVVE